MAIAKDDFYKQFRGAVDDTIVVKHYPDKIVLTKIPDMSNVIQSALQLEEKQQFGNVSKQAAAILKNPEAKKAALVRLGCAPNELYHTLIKDFNKKL